MSVLKIISEWDPQNLMSHAPDDEYEFEAQAITHALSTVRDENDLAESIRTIFVSTFDDDFK